MSHSRSHLKDSCWHSKFLNSLSGAILIITLVLWWTSPARGDEVVADRLTDRESSAFVVPEIQPQVTLPIFDPYNLEPIGRPPQAWNRFPPNLRSNSGPTFRLRGRIEVDSIGISQSAANQAAFGNLTDTTGLRRARIGAEGNLTPNSRYIAEIDLASGQVVIRDLFVGVGAVQETGEYKFGHMREPFSLEGGTSANTLAFMERSPINDLDPARNWGIGFVRCSPNEDSMIALGVFKSGADSNDTGVGNGSDSAATAKVTKLLWYDDHGAQLMHVGMATSARIPDNQMLVINQTPSSPLLDLGDSSASSFVPKVTISSGFEQLFNAQWAYVNGPLWSQAEWYGSLIEQRGGQNLFLHGSYFAVGYFVTGEHRDYLKQSGVIGPLTVARPFLSGFSSHSHPKGNGAWELAARISYLDFSDLRFSTGPQGPNVGTTLPQLTLGVNWYLADRLRIMFNYNYVVPDESTTGTSTASMFSTRFAMFW